MGDKNLKPVSLGVVRLPYRKGGFDMFVDITMIAKCALSFPLVAFCGTLDHGYARYTILHVAQWVLNYIIHNAKYFLPTPLHNAQ